MSCFAGLSAEQQDAVLSRELELLGGGEQIEAVAQQGGALSPRPPNIAATPAESPLPKKAITKGGPKKPKSAKKTGAKAKGEPKPKKVAAPKLMAYIKSEFPSALKGRGAVAHTDKAVKSYFNKALKKALEDGGLKKVKNSYCLA